MTLATIEHDIESARDEFRALNRQHFQWCTYADRRTPFEAKIGYRRLLDDQERRLGEIADRLARLRRFEALIRIKGLQCMY